ncbi:hypothetical protein NP603_02305 [Methylomonas sp. SURF-1]|uniref:Uncharacterized protein n=1 Tax=Methylomonas aurea TaxID=2952224 RepID=A0ABT1UE17_9GAMM|nr:hypothetical protein [Methylomonas sp. SURF-1]MCQ8179930.1 hypothetical protein [Methylomonas sp. SURF-1]
MCFALWVLRMQIGAPADLSARQPSDFSLLGQRKVTKRKATPPVLGAAKGMVLPATWKRNHLAALA